MRFSKQLILNLTGFIVLAAGWQMVSWINKSPAMPPLDSIIKTLIHFIGNNVYLQHISSSVTIILHGIGLAVIFGFLGGVLIFRYSMFKAVVMPVVESVRGVAALTLFPLLIVLFGLGNFSRIFVIFWTAWPAVLLSTANSLDVDTAVVDAARIAGAGEWRIIFNIRIPMAAQGIITGIRIGVSGGWIGLIAAEMLGATKGLGYYLLWSAQSFEFEKVYATIIVIAAIGGLMNLILLLAQEEIYKITGGT